MKETDFSNRREYWKQLMKDQRASGRSVAEFCNDRGISKFSFYGWSRRFRRKRTGVDRSALVPVEIVTAPVCEPTRIVFQNGVAIHFTQRPDPAWVMELLRLVS